MSQATLAPILSPFVSLHNGRPATTSLEVAKYFGKRHDNIIRDIKQILDNCPKEFTALNFEVSKYIDETGRNLVMYILYRDGFMLLAMGYTGKKALQIKLAYIEAFNQMEAQLKAIVNAKVKLMLDIFLNSWIVIRMEPKNSSRDGCLSRKSRLFSCPF